MKALIIGASGFVGPYLVEEVRNSLFCEVITTTSRKIGKLGIGEDKTVNLNIRDKEQISRILFSEKPDYIFHLAAQSSVALSWRDPKSTVDINIIGAINLINAVQQSGYTPRVLIAGSGEEYGRVRENDIPIKESAALSPGNVYAVTKACQNMMASIYSRAYALPLVMTRSFNHIGPGQSRQFVVADFCSQVVEIEQGKRDRVIRVGNLSAKRDFTDVRDVVKAYCRLIQYGKSGETYNVGSGRAISIQEILDIILSQTTANVIIENDPARLRPVDVPIIEADISKIYKDTGWKPTISLPQTITDTLQYWRGHTLQ